MSIILYLILFFCAPLIAGFYNQPLLTPITRIYSINLIINSLVAVNKTKLLIKVDFETQSKISLIAAFGSGVLGIIAALNHLGVWALVVQMLAHAIFNVFLTFGYVKWFPQKAFSTDSFRKLFKFGSKLLVSSIIHNVYSNMYNVVIGKRFTSSDLGFFTRANHFAIFTGRSVSDVLQRVIFPILSQIQDDDSKLLSVYQRYIKIVTFVVFPVIMLMFGTAKPLILILLGDKWNGCILLLQLLSFKCLWTCVIQLNLNLLYVKGRSDLVLKLEFIKKSIAFSILATTMFFDLTVVCIGQVIYSMIALYLNTIYTKRILNYGFRTQIKEFLPWLLLSFAMGVECYLIVDLFENKYFSLFTSAISGITTYLLVSYGLKFRPLTEIWNLAKEKKWKNHYA